MGQLVSSDAPDVSGQVDYGFGADGPADEDEVVWNGGTDNGNGETQVQGQFGTLTIDANGNYTYQLDQAAYDELATGETEEDIFNYTLTDADGDGVESSLAINITGEAAPQRPNLAPEAENQSVSLDIGAVTTDLMLTLDVSGSMVIGTVGDTGKTRFDIAQEALVSTIQAYSEIGGTDVNLTLFSADATNLGWMTSENAIDYINNLEVYYQDSTYGTGVYYNGTNLGLAAGTDYKDAINETELTDFSGRNADQTIAYFLSDGEPNENDSAVGNDNTQTIRDWKDYIDTDVNELFVIGIGSNVSDQYLEHVQVQEGKDPLIVTDESQLEQTLTNTAQVSVSGDVSNSVSGGDGDISFDSITLYGTTYTADGGNGTTAFPSGGVPLDGQGTLMFDFTNGEYTYSAGATEFEEGLTQKQFSVSVSDEDGDSTSLDVNIDVTAPDMAASEPELEGELVTPPTITTTSETEMFNDDDSVTLRGGGSQSSHTYTLDGTATGFSLDIDDYSVNGGFLGWGDDDATIKLYKDGGQVGSTINLDNHGEGTLDYSGSVEFDTVFVERTDGRFDISDFSAEVTKEVITYEYGLDLSAALTDTDGSESLSGIIIDGLPSGVSVTGTNTSVTDNNDGTYTVALDTNGEPMGDVTLISDSQLSQAEQEAITISVTATESSNGAENTITAQLVDGIVEGAMYSTSSGLTGTTDENGAFEYREGDSITFMVGDVVIGTATNEDLADGKVFLQEFANVSLSDLNDEYVENMAVFLQSLDSDGNANTGITITPEMHAKFAGVSLDLRTVAEADLSAAIEEVGQVSVTEDEAMAHVREMLEIHAGVTDFDERIDDSLQTATLATGTVDGVRYETSSGLSGDVTDGLFEYRDGDTIDLFIGDQSVASFSAENIAENGMISFDDAGFTVTQDELEALLSPDDGEEATDEESEATDNEDALEEEDGTEEQSADDEGSADEEQTDDEEAPSDVDDTSQPSEDADDASNNDDESAEDQVGEDDQVEEVDASDDSQDDLAPGIIPEEDEEPLFFADSDSNDDSSAEESTDENNDQADQDESEQSAETDESDESSDESSEALAANDILSDGDDEIFKDEDGEKANGKPAAPGNSEQAHVNAPGQQEYLDTSINAVDQ
nr:VCBS domain-containing protein [Halomonas llamarensis]